MWGRAQKASTWYQSGVKRIIPLLILAGLIAVGAELSTTQADPIRAAVPTPPSPNSPLANLPIQRHTLDNGLRIVLSPDRTVPTVAVAVYYDVGSRNEEVGRSGFAHLFEHMMFQGSANVGKGEHFVYIRNRGGRANGTTNHDRTNYFETLPSNELALGLWLEADRMRSLAVTPENFENQRETVKEERRQSYEDRPYALSMLRINELAYGGYWPYSHSTIGDMQDLDNAPLEAVQQFFSTWYKPNNAVLSISGDFDPAEALRLAAEHFGNIPSGDIPEYAPPALAPQTAERTETMPDRLAQRAAFHLAYHIPPNREQDHYALELLALVLGDGDSSRLYQKLVKEEELCVQVSVTTDDRRGPDLFGVFGVMAGDHEPEEARNIIYAELEAVAQNGVTERELQKAHNRLTAYFAFGLQSNLSRAQRLAEYEMYYGSAGLIRDELGRYLAVDRAAIQRVAQQYFAATNRTVLDVMPTAAGADE